MIEFIDKVMEWLPVEWLADLVVVALNGTLSLVLSFVLTLLSNPLGVVISILVIFYIIKEIYVSDSCNIERMRYFNVGWLGKKVFTSSGDWHWQHCHPSYLEAKLRTSELTNAERVVIYKILKRRGESVDG